MTVTETAYGKLRGTEIADGVIAWRGVPYARPPLGDLRLRPPEPPEAWPGVRDAADYGNRSLQPEPLPDPALPPMDEDCLYLNVTAPAGVKDRPVLFWVHGGGHEMGHGTDQAGDGAAFARSHGLVVVTFNYRLGALGYLDVPGESPTGAIGLHDQIAALRWTHQNIAAFGGDPARITVLGWSAGGKTVSNMLASPLTRGMIARASELSGGDHLKDPAQAAGLTEAFFRELGATPARLRSVPARDIRAAQDAIAVPPRSSWIWRPSIDGTALASHPLAALRAGAAAGIPLLMQTCVREAVYADLLSGDAAEQVGEVVTGYFGAESWDKLLAAYAASHPGLDDRALRLAVMTDERYVVRVDRLADAQSAHAPVWRSRYDGPYAGSLASPALAGRAKVLEGAHGSDCMAIWEGSEGLAAALHDAWGAFVTTGDPGWARYTTGDRQAMIFGSPEPHVAGDPFGPAREAWQSLEWQPATWWSY